MNADKFKELVKAVPNKSDLRVSDMREIYEAAKSDIFMMITYAFAYGFHRGANAAEKGKKS